MTAVGDFLADPLGFMQSRIVYPGSTDITRASFPSRSGIYDCTLLLNDRLQAYSRKAKRGREIEYYNLVPALPAEESFPAYWLRFEMNSAHGMAIGNRGVDPQFMFTVRMNSCTLGHCQATRNHPAYVSHHNAQAQGNTADAMEGLAIQWDGGALPNTNMNYSHRGEYMKDERNGMYGATTFGIRDASGVWHFYFQRSKGHGQKHQNLSLKGVEEISVG